VAAEAQFLHDSVSVWEHRRLDWGGGATERVRFVLRWTTSLSLSLSLAGGQRSLLGRPGHKTSGAVHCVCVCEETTHGLASHCNRQHTSQAGEA